jgi:hypothetical protein
MPSQDPTDAVLAALEDLETVLRETTERNRTAILRADAIRRLREGGHRYSDIVPMEERPLIVELLTQSLSELSDASSHFRKVEARALYSEGLTMAEIAELFGVTRQRIAALLNSGIGANSDEGAVDQPRPPGRLRGFIPIGLAEALDESLILFKRFLD